MPSLPFIRIYPRNIVFNQDTVMAGLVPAIHVFLSAGEDVDTRPSPGMTVMGWAGHFNAGLA